MANNYTEFSELIECQSKAQQKWLLQELSKDDRSYACVATADKSNVWVHSDESGDLAVVASVVGEFQKKFKITSPWVGSYCHYCDHPRINEFGGGAVVVHRGKQTWFHATSMAEEKARKLK